VRLRQLQSIGIQIGGIGALAPAAATTWRGSACGAMFAGRGQFHDRDDRRFLL